MVLKKIFSVDSAINGKGLVHAAWSRDSTQLAIVGEQRKINIFDRHGKISATGQLPSSNVPTAIAWAPSSTIVAVMQEKSSGIALFYPGSKKIEVLETGLKDLCELNWSRTSDLLMCGNANGAMLLFHADTMRKSPVTGRHKGKIVSSTWGSTKGWFAVTSEDKCVTISDSNGEQLDRAVVKGVASEVKFAQKKTDTRGSKEDSTLSMLLNSKTLLLYQVQSKESLVELTFNPKYGDIVSHSWYGDGYLIIGFVSGQVSVLSSHPKEIGAEISTMNGHKKEGGALQAMSVNRAISRGASLGPKSLRVFDLDGLQISESKSEHYEFESDFVPAKLEWTEDGQILAVTSKTGSVQCFMTRLPTLCVGNQSSTRILYLSSLTEMCVRDVANEFELAKVTIDLEPSFAALSDSTLGFGMNNIVQFFSYDAAAAASAQKVKKAKNITQKQYPSTVDDLVISANFAAALMATAGTGGAGKALLSTFDGQKSRQFPERQDAGHIVSHTLTSNFYVFGTTVGYYVMFSLEDFQTVCEYKHTQPIRSIWTNTEATRSIIVDQGNQAHVFNPVTEIAVQIENAQHSSSSTSSTSSSSSGMKGSGMERFLWDSVDPSIVVGCDGQNFVTFVYSSTTRYGPTCNFFRKVSSKRYTPGSGSSISSSSISSSSSGSSEKPLTTSRPLAYLPAACFRGTVYGQSPSGSTHSVQLQSHLLPQTPVEQFRYYLQLNRLEEAFQICSGAGGNNNNNEQRSSPSPSAAAGGGGSVSPTRSDDLSAQQVEMQRELAERALHLLDVNFAIRCFRSLNAPTTVMALERISHVQEKNLLMGHICSMFKQFNEAQNFFTRSSSPYLALEMRRDLLHWDQALHLAETLAEDQVPALSKECAAQYEFKGEHTHAKDHYLKGILKLPAIRQDDATSVAAFEAAQNQNDQSRAGAARCLFRMGNFREGMQLLDQLSEKADTDVFEQCASILQEMRQFDEAARMYERAGKFDDACAIYITDTKHMRQAQLLLPKVKSRNVLMLFAQAKEADMSYSEAANAYDRAEDWDNAVRIRVEFLNDLPGAYKIVRQTRSAEAAALVANVCKKRKEFSAAIEFLLLARQTREAFTLAKEKQVMSAFETSLLQQVQLNEFGIAPQSRHLDFRMVGEYYDEQKKPGIAADFYLIGADYDKSLDRLTDVDTEESIEKAIEVVARAKSDRLTAKFMDYLQGNSSLAASASSSSFLSSSSQKENQSSASSATAAAGGSGEKSSSNNNNNKEKGAPKDPKYFFQLYMALKNYDKVAKTALIISNKEQEIGNYREAHKMLVDTILLLQKRNIRIAGELRRSLMLLHSYVIVKHLMKPLEDHQTATRMLLRVARNINKFPKHEAAILASTVVECARTEFKSSAYQYACVLVQNEKLRKEIPDKLIRKVDAVIRKRGKEELADPTEHTSLCPFCSNPVEETQLECTACQNYLPSCIVTGKHMTLEDWSQCPTCEFPALIGPFQQLLQATSECPMCGEKCESYLIEKISLVDVKKFV